SLRALFGGTFDPVHYGHLKPVETLADLIALSRVIIMPSNVPPHRPQPQAASAQRKYMLELAIADTPLFTLDERELQRNAPSYTSHTLKAWREAHAPEAPIAFIIGQDSLLNFPPWHVYDPPVVNALPLV
ncbi:nicotinate-nucleotide adenylyltransferase, partial [Salmonella enterica]|uniref:nicotinate-nucleotide adenylyltransferase n=1 Tax=Salmonella enterica TaxID=28901 RepID=UPI0007DC29FD